MSTPPTLLIGYGTLYLNPILVDKRTTKRTKKQRQKHNLPVGGNDSSSTETVRKTNERDNSETLSIAPSVSSAGVHKLRLRLAARRRDRTSNNEPHKAPEVAQSAS